MRSSPVDEELSDSKGISRILGMTETVVASKDCMIGAAIENPMPPTLGKRRLGFVTFSVRSVEADIRHRAALGRMGSKPICGNAADIPAAPPV
ncbi:hypothetical protein [Roseovarius sp. Pro17]|uniref:hypothetical protein n=1 Tax=Roseovarius sp. Pro17 TaxID=3108175 RepID=UPI002D7A3CB9|nr:hypothetical protein [Roseovarius sp. Pro17]